MFLIGQGMSARTEVSSVHLLLVLQLEYLGSHRTDLREYGWNEEP